MNNVKIRAFRDGNDFVVYFEDCNIEMENFLKNLLNPVIESDSNLESVDVIENDPVVPDGFGKISGLHISEVLSKQGNKGYANISYLKDQKVFNTRDTSRVNEILNEYLVDKFSSIDPQEYAGSLDMAQADEWIKCFDSIITASTKSKVINLTGFETYEDFIKEGTLEQKVSLIYNVIVNMGFNF